MVRAQVQVPKCMAQGDPADMPCCLLVLEAQLHPWSRQELKVYRLQGCFLGSSNFSLT